MRHKKECPFLYAKITAFTALLCVLTAGNAILAKKKLQSLESQATKSISQKLSFQNPPYIRAIYDNIPTFFDIDSLITKTLEEHRGIQTKAAPKKKWTILVYIAADNDLNTFAYYNIKQMKRIGSSDKMNIIVELHTSQSKHKKTLHRMIIEKDDLILAKSLSTPDDKIDSGDPSTLIDFCTWAIKNYPAEKIGLILWNHGIGVIDPVLHRGINPSDLFSFNTSTNLVELDRSVGFLDFIGSKMQQEKERGVCFDDSTGNYLTNDDLDMALTEIIRENNNKKLSFVAFDACLMSMIEIMAYLHKHAELMVGSQEVELGAGWNYAKVLSPIKDHDISKEDFVKHIVNVYEETYQGFFPDFTLAAIDLSKISPLIENIDITSQHLLSALFNQKANTVAKAISISRNRKLCTSFDEPSYIDLDHFYSNLYSNVDRCTFSNKKEGEKTRTALKKTITKGRSLIKEAVIINHAGEKLSRAQGISIYFPERRIHSSYRRTIFAHETSWIHMLSTLLNSREY
ncbi:hypothetical protein HN446_02635 [bacterium]|jgi:hypothetical protein|nr:hypothetical protein [bacterium]